MPKVRSASPEFNPGSPEAVVRGCTCSPAENHNGLGAWHPTGRKYFACDWQCPMHGIEAMKPDFVTGEARMIPPPEFDPDLSTP